MPFRANEARQAGYERARRYLVSRDLKRTDRARSARVFDDLVDRLGPVVESYPHWHPLVAAQSDPQVPVTTPSGRCGYKELDHTVYFVHGFVTCPYSDGQEVIDSVESLPDHPLAEIVAERLKVPLYHRSTTAVLVRCRWLKPLPSDRMVPKSWVVPLILERELPAWRWAEVAENWDTMRPYFLGSPHGRRSSLFVSQDTGQVIKNVWNVLIHTGMFGPIRTDLAARL